MSDWDGTIAGASEQFIDADGCRTHYYRAGNGPATVLLHGGGAGADAYGNWRGLLGRMAGTLDVIAMDMLGFGQTDKPDPGAFEYTQQARVNHVIATLEALAPGPVNLVGNSMGGMTSMGVAIERPDLVNRVVLMGSAGVRTPMTDALKTIAFYDETVEGMRKIVDVLTNDGFQPPPGMIEYRHALSVRDDTRAAYAATMDWIKAQGGLYYEEDYMRRLERPALVVNGKNDEVIPMSSGYRLMELIPGARGYFIPDCGHWAMIEHPEEFAAITLQFLGMDLGD